MALSAALTAVILTELVLGGSVRGAMYRPVAEMVPTVGLPPAYQFTCQLPAVLTLPVRCTVAVNCCHCPTNTVAELGVTVTPVTTPTVTAAVPLLVASALLTAVTVTA